MKTDIGIIGALAEEVEGLIARLKKHKTEQIGGIEFHLGIIEKKHVVIARCGVGKVIAAICAQAGVEIYKLNQVLFETNSLSKLRLHAWMIEHLDIFDDGKLAIVAIPRAVEELLGVTDDDVDNISSYPRTVEGVCMAATLRQSKTGETKRSVRAIPGYDAAAVCAHFGGGGHKGAAGATTSLSLEEAVKAVKEAMLNG